MSRIRTFIAVPVSEEQREQLVSVQRAMGRSASGVKWVEAENLHVTLLFLGEVDEREVISVCRAVTECCEKVAP